MLRVQAGEVCESESAAPHTAAVPSQHVLPPTLHHAACTLLKQIAACAGWGCALSLQHLTPQLSSQRPATRPSPCCMHFAEIDGCVCRLGRYATVSPQHLTLQLYPVSVLPPALHQAACTSLKQMAACAGWGGTRQ